LLQVVLDRARARHPEFPEEGWWQEPRAVRVAGRDHLDCGVHREAAHELLVVALADALAAFIVARVAEESADRGEAPRSARFVERPFLGEGEQGIPLVHPSLPADSIDIGPAVVIVPAKRHDAILLRVPFDPDHVAGLERLASGVLNSYCCCPLNPLVSADVRMARTEMAAVAVYKVIQCPHVLFRHVIGNSHVPVFHRYIADIDVGVNQPTLSVD
jgi:hypothetical protein